MMNNLFYNPLGFFTLLKKEINRFMKVYIQTLIAPLLSNILFLGVFNGMFQTRNAGIEGVGYLGFLVPGLVTMGAIFAAFQNPTFSIIVQKFQGTLQDLNSYPMSNFEKTLAYVLGGTVRGFLIGFLTYIATIFFIGAKISHPILFFTAILIISFIFASVGLIVGLFAEKFERVNFILSIILTPLVYFGGVFFEVSKLPGIFSKIVVFNPIYPLVNFTRYAYLGVFEGNMLIQLIYIGIITISTFFISFFLFNKGIGLKN